MSTNDKLIKLIAFYFPQFHPIPENDIWWGQGFTDWVNVVKARPLFPGHYQPHIPSELGYYDLRRAEVRTAQADLAREYGIQGFCYFHYWMHGKRLLETPFNEVLESGKPDFPFCLCWANETWTRRWDGNEKAVLIRQRYSQEDDLEHIRWLVKAFKDKRYIRFEGKPIFLVYRVPSLPNPLKTTALWREEARKLGIGEIYLCQISSFVKDCVDPSKGGFDAAVEFQPDYFYLGVPLNRSKLRDYFFEKLFPSNLIYDYPTVVQNMIQKEKSPYKQFSCVTPSWDNTARRKTQATILTNSTPDMYEMWLRAAIEKSVKLNGENDLIFINAWNEWAEGNHLEPCQKWGRAYLEATARAQQ